MEVESGSAESIESFYLARGVCPAGTVTDGDCGIDAMCVLSSSPQNAQTRVTLRAQLSEFFLRNAEHNGLQTALRCAQEFAHDPGVAASASLVTTEIQSDQGHGPAGGDDEQREVCS